MNAVSKMSGQIEFLYGRMNEENTTGEMRDKNRPYYYLHPIVHGRSFYLIGIIMSERVNEA